MTSGEKVEVICRTTLERCVFPLKNKKPLSIGNFVLEEGMKVLVDGEYRDEALWAGDYYSAGPASLKYLGDGGETWRNSLLAIASRQYANGKLPSCVSTKLKYRFLSPFIESYNFWWILTADEYIKKTNDQRFQEVFKKVLEGIIKYLSPKVGKDLLIVMDWPNIDWNWTIVRPRKSALSNALWYKVLKIADEYGIRHGFDLPEMKKSFNNYFWDEKLAAFSDKGTVYLDANSLAVLFGLADAECVEKICSTLEKTIGEYGPVSYLGNPGSIVSWHKNQICPFASYLYVKALESCGRKERAREVFEKTMATALAIHHKYDSDTLPEFWKSDGSLGGGPAIPFAKNQVFAVSLCHSWATFGDYNIDEKV